MDNEERVLKFPRAATEVSRDAAQGRDRSSVSVIRSRDVTPRCARLAPSLRAGAAGFSGLRYPSVAYNRYAVVGCLAPLARRSQRGAGEF